MKNNILTFIILLFNLAGYSQYGFRDFVPYQELQLDTPYTFENLNDFLQIRIDEKGNQDTLLRCSVNKNGAEVQRISRFMPSDSSLNCKSIKKYDKEGKLISSEAHYPNLKMNSKLFYTYNSKELLQKVEYFSYELIEIYSTNIIPDSTYFAWKETDIWIFKYNGSNKLTEVYHGDRFYQSDREVSNYDSAGKITGKVTYRGSCCNSAGRDANEVIDTTNSFTEEITLRDTFIYFKNGYLIEHIIYNPFNEIEIRRDSILTDSKGRIIAEFWSDVMLGLEFPSGVQLNYAIEKKIEYDKLSRKIREVYFDQKGKTESRYHYNYESKFDLIGSGF